MSAFPPELKCYPQNPSRILLCATSTPQPISPLSPWLGPICAAFQVAQGLVTMSFYAVPSPGSVFRTTSTATNTFDGKFHSCSSRRFVTLCVKEKHPLADAYGTLLLHTAMLQSQKRKYRMTLEDFDLVGSLHDVPSFKACPRGSL